MKLDREAITAAAIEHGRAQYALNPDKPLGENIVGAVVDAICAAIEAATEPRCPRQHLSPAAEQRAREEQGPCPCASCLACRERGMA